MAYQETRADEGGADAIDALLRDGGIRAVYQPIVELSTRRPVAFEALGRGPAGSPMESPAALFPAARAARRLADLDQACRVAALSGALDAGLKAPWTLFVNVEPEALGTEPTPALEAAITRAAEHFTIVFELTERALTAQPAELLRTVGQIREHGWRVALDDVGAEVGSLALMPLLRPDVIKLDLSLVQRRADAEIAEIVNAVNAEAERTGALVLAEGIETEAHVDIARALGASLGQGWLFGRPGPLPSPLPRPGRALGPSGALVHTAFPTPFQTASSVRTVRPSAKRLLIEMSKHLERQALSLGGSSVVLATFQEARHFTPATTRRYEELGRRSAFVAAFGEGMPPEPAAGVRGAVLGDDDPVRGEWDIAVVGPHFAAALVARDLGDDGPDLERRFEYVLTYDRDLAVRVAGALMSRVAPDFDASTACGADAASQAIIPLAPRLDERVTAAAAASLERQALDATTVGVTIADAMLPDQPLRYVNPAFTTLTGYRPEEVLGRNCRFLQGPETDRAAVVEFTRAMVERRETRVRLRNYRKDGTPWWNEVHVTPVIDELGRVTHYVGIQQDVTARVEAEQRVAYLAYHDSLTGLLNRAGLSGRLDAAIASARAEHRSVALLFCDLDDFKAVNDEHGHAAGDELLKQAATRLRGVARRGDVLARQGGDEFLLVLGDLPEDADRVAATVADHVREALARPFAVGGALLRVGVSVGIAVFPAEAVDLDALFRRADASMYADKARQLRLAAAG